MRTKAKIAICAFILVVSVLIIYHVRNDDDLPKSSESISYAESVSAQRLDVDLAWYRLYHPSSNKEDAIRFIRSLFALWVYSNDEFVEYCYHFPTFQRQDVENQFSEILVDGDVFDLQRFGPLQVRTNEGRLDLFVKGEDRHLWIESFAIKNGDVSNFRDLSKDDIWRRFVDEFRNSRSQTN